MAGGWAGYCTPVSINPGSPMEPAIYDNPTFDRAVGVVVKLFALFFIVVGAAMTVGGFVNPVLLVFGVPLLVVGVVFFARSWRAKSGAQAEDDEAAD